MKWVKTRILSLLVLSKSNKRSYKINTLFITNLTTTIIGKVSIELCITMKRDVNNYEDYYHALYS